MGLKRFLAIGLTLATLPITSAVYAAENAPAMEDRTSAAEPQAHALTAEDLRVFFDGLVPYSIHRGDIAGATIAVVKDGHILFAQGYGYADLKTKAPVIADQSMFRPGSVSKLFTWTSVMQLVEQGKLDLDRDVNDYLDFKVPEKFGKPITLRTIMTHTSGFEEVAADVFVEKSSNLYPLRDFLVKHMPERIFPPGKVVAYSNYATTLAGYIVQRVSGEEFSDYVANHIFTPLGMNHSTFKQPLPASLEPFMAKGYRQASAEKPVPFENVEAAPAGSLSSTATDMAHFMIAHIDGEYDGVRILKPETLKAMHSRNYTLAPELLNGFNLGFYDENRNGHRIIGHAGDTGAFHSDLHLILDTRTGIFMSFNSAGKEGEAEVVRTAVFRSFLDRYFPFTPPEEQTVADPKKDAARVAGYYLSSRRKESALKVLFYLGQTEVSALPDGRITVGVFKDFSGAVKKWREVGPLNYREVGGQTHLQFVTDEHGNIDYFATDDFLPVFLFQRAHGLEQLDHMKILGIGSLLVCLLALAVAVGGWIVRWRFGRTLEMSALEGQLRLASRLGALLFLLVIAGWFGLVAAISADEFLLFNGGLNGWIMALYITGVLAVLGGVAMVVNGLLRIVRGPGGILVRAGEVFMVIAGLYGIWAIFDYGLANFHFNI